MILRAHAASPAAPDGRHDEYPAPAGRIVGRRCAVRTLDSHGADVREERIARRRSGLDGGSREMPIQVENRRQIGLQEGDAHAVQSRRRLEADTHRRTAAAAEKCLRTGLSASSRRLPATAAIGRRRPASALPIHQLQPLAIQDDVESLARNRTEAGRRHVVAENRRHGDVYSPSDGNTCLTSIPPRVPNGKPSM